MLRKVLKLNGTQKLEKNQLKNINGGSTVYPMPNCNALCIGFIKVDFFTGDCFCVTS